MRIFCIGTALAVLMVISCALRAQVPQRSFAQESRPHAWYVDQACLWWEEVQRDSTSEQAWFHYFRACRNAHGTADWRTDFVKESPCLRSGPDILQLMERSIPATFTWYYLSYLDQGIGTANSELLLKAYAMNPDFEGIHSSMVSYAVSGLNDSLRKAVNKKWFTTNYLSPQLLAYGYNVLQSLDTGAVLLTQHDNDSYPVWMLQDALGIRPDVTAINIDFLLLPHYRDSLFRQLGVPPMALEVKSSDDYRENWHKVVSHLLTHYSGSRPLYAGLTLSASFYKEFESKLHLSGLALRYGNLPPRLNAFNRRLYEEVFLLDSLKHLFVNDPNQANVNDQNLNYLQLFKILFESYRAGHQSGRAAEVKSLALLVAGRADDEDLMTAVRRQFAPKQ